MSSPTYVRNDDGTIGCARHGVSFDPAHGSCALCDVDPGAPLDMTDEPLPPPPAGCESTLDIERHLRAEADRLLAVAHTLAKIEPTPGLVNTGTDGASVRKKPKPDRKHVATAVKTWEVWLKVKRAQREVAREREHEEIVRQREKRDAEREAGRPH